MKEEGFKLRAIVFRLCIVLWLFSLGSALYAQSASGQITGTVKDSTGAMVAGAAVSVSSQLTGQTRRTTTNESGTFSFPLLPVSVYSVTVDQKGFRSSKRTDITLNVDQVSRIDIDLQVGEVTETVNVQESAVSIDTESASVGQVVTQQQVSQLPLNGRNFLQLLFLGAGAVETTGEQGGMRRGAGNAISINGSRPTSNNYMLDGTANTDTALGTPAVVLSVDAIQEFKLQTSTYSAEYGFSANQVNIISKSGTNDLHGTVFWFLRNNAFDARSYFQRVVPPLRQNQPGFVVGGPVIIPKLYNGRNKTFWLANYEGLRLRQGADFFGNVPTPAMLAGNFPTTVTDPLNGVPFPGNVIPAARFSRLTRVALAEKFWPSPNINVPQGNYRAILPAPTNQNQQTYRIDQSLGKFGNIFARGSLVKFDATVNNNITPNGRTFFTQESVNWQVSHSVTLGPRVVNQFRIGKLEATANQFGVFAPQSAVDAIGLTGVFQNLSDTTRTWPSIGMRGFSGVGGAVNAYQASFQPMWDISNSMTIIKGNHTITTGVNYRRWSLNRDLANNFLGNFTYQGFFTGSPVGDMLLGNYQNAALFQPAPFALAGKSGNPRQFNFQYFAPYVQDDWKVTKNLTVNLGLRWDFRTMPNESNNRMGWLDVANPRGGMCIADESLVEKGIAPAGNGFYRFCGRTNPAASLKTPFAPRAGFAWRPFGGDKTVIRGGYGIFFDSAEGREIDGSADIYPYVSRGTFFQTLGQTAAIQTTDSLFPSFSRPGPVTPAANSFIAVIIAERAANPYVQQWSLSIQRQLSSNTTLEVNYLGNKGTNLLMRRNIAQARPPVDPSNPGTVLSRRPFSQFGVYINSDWSGNSSYNSGNVKLEHRSKNFLLTSVYTWAKSIDNKSAAAGIGSAATGWQGFLDNNDVRRDRGLSDFNVDHRMVHSFVYTIPVGRGGKYLANAGKVANVAVGGWQVNGIVTMQTGFPFPIFAEDVGGLLDNFSNRANLVGDPRSGFTRSTAQWFNTKAFQQPAAGVLGNSGRNILRAPGINNFDLSAFKNFQVVERLSLQFRVESFNAFNHTQFGTPVTNMVSPQFGQVTSARAGRVNQLGLKFVF